MEMNQRTFLSYDLQTVLLLFPLEVRNCRLLAKIDKLQMQKLEIARFLFFSVGCRCRVRHIGSSYNGFSKPPFQILFHVCCWLLRTVFVDVGNFPNSWDFQSIFGTEF